MRWRLCVATTPLLTVLAGACAAPETVREARDGRYPELLAALDAKVHSFTMSNHEAYLVAHAVATREIDVADGTAAPLRVHEVRACAPELDDALARRMEKKDDAGALAAEARLEDGQLSESDARDLASAQDAPWRAVGTRALTRDEDRAVRRRALLDPAPAVRRAAVHAMQAAGSASREDVDVLFAVARLDPEPLVRTDAVRAIARLAAGPGVSSRLRDLWVAADDPLREDIAAAWASRGLFSEGGREALRTLLAAETGPGVLSGAGAILRAPHAKGGELRASAIAVLARAIAGGVHRDRLHAIAIAPLHEEGAELLSAVRKASFDDDSSIRLAALSRLTEVRAEQQVAVQRLEELAESDRPDVRSRARFALASAGDTRVEALLVSDLADGDREVRLGALRALGILGVVGRGAPLLADPDASVRTRAACAVLVASAGGR